MNNSIIGGRYQIIKRIGRGAFGETFLSEDIETKQKCVVKKLKPMVKDENTLEIAKRLFKKEAETLEKLGNHPQIPALLAYYEEELSIVQEFIEGRSLEEDIHRGKILNKSEVEQILEEVLEILVFVHDRQVIHRDIKPSNLIRRYSDGKLVLIDFGAVKEISTLETNIQTGQTSVTVAIGTVGFMSPEQQQGKPKCNSDIYALGMMGIQALTGKSPKEIVDDERSYKEILQRHSNASSKLITILEKMVRPDWKERYQNSSDVINDLKHGMLPSSTLNMGIKFAVAGTLGALLWFVFPFVRSVFLFQKGIELINQQEYIEAVQFFDQIIEINPNAANSLYYKGFALSQLGRFEQQLISCQRASQIQPNFVEAINCQGLALYSLGKYQESLEFYRKTTDIQIDFYQGYYNLGESLVKLKRFEEALEAFDRAKLYQPDYVIAWNNHGNALFALERYPEAIASYDQAIKINPNYAYAYLGRGNAKRKQGRFQEAILDYNKVTELEPQLYEVYYTKALVHRSLQQCELSIEDLDRGIEIKPDYLAAIRLREQILNNCE